MTISFVKHQEKRHELCRFSAILRLTICVCVLAFFDGFAIPNNIRGPFLQIGEWYILSLTPTASYSNNSDLMVSTELVGELLGFSIRQQLGTVRIQYRRSILSLQIGQKQASLDGKLIEFSIAPTRKGETTLIPLGSILKALDIKWSWIHNGKVFAVTDERILDETLNPDGLPRLKDIFEMFLASGLPTNNALIPTLFQWDQETRRYRLSIAPASRLGDLKRYGASVLFDMGGQFVYAGDGMLTTTGPQKDGCIRKTESIECSGEIHNLLITPKWVFVRIWESSR